MSLGLLKKKEGRWKSNFFVYVIFLAIIFSFGAGMVLGGQMVRKRYVAAEAKDEMKNSVDMDILFEVWKKLSEKYVGEVPDEPSMVQGMAKGMTEALKDPYTTFFVPEKAKQFKEDLKGSFGGIGAEIGVKDDVLTVVSPLDDTPAKEAGIKPGDKILKIDGEETGNLELDEAISKIRGEKDTKVKLTIFSEGSNEPKEVEISRATIDPKSVKWEIKEGDVAYIRLASFSEDSVKEFVSIAGEVKKSAAKKIILDLRGNPGGYLETAVSIAGFFLKPDTLVVREDYGGKRAADEYKTEYSPVLEGYPLVILIDRGSASASEILAGALSEQMGAKLVGEKTFGKGSVQEFFTLSDGSTLKVTVAEWLTPKGKCINKEGISPEIEEKINFDQEKENFKDNQLEKALEVAKSL